jgi:hypothetical protein
MKKLFVIAILMTCTACGSNTQQFSSPAYDPMKARAYSQLGAAQAAAHNGGQRSAGVVNNQYAPVPYSGSPYTARSQGSAYRHAAPAQQVYYRGSQEQPINIAHNGQYFYRVR